MLSAPLCVKDRCVGVLRVYHREPHRFTEEEQGLAKTLATHAGIALERLRLLHERAALGEVARAISSSLDRATVLSTIVRQAAEVLGFKGASIRLLDEDGEMLDLEATHGMSDDYMSKGPVEVAKSPLDQEALSGREVVVQEADMGARLQYPEDARREGIRSILCLPLPVRGRPVGVLRVYSSTPYPFSADDIDFLKSLASQGAIAIENARLFEHLRRDYEDLTRDVWKWYDWGERPPRT
jgi:GAF domain-containing protein